VIDQSGDLALGGASGFTWGTEFFDFDNDGDLDLYMASEGEGEMPYATLWRNEGDGTFNRINQEAFGEEIFSNGNAAGFADYDGDGDIDIYAPSNAFGPVARGGFFLNLVGTQNHWLGLDLTTAVGDREAVGARILVTAGGRTQIREVRTSAVATSPVLFGLGDAHEIEQISIRWPDGTIQLVAGVFADQLVPVFQGEDPCLEGQDSDGDGRSDICDVCPFVFNPGQGLACVPALSGPALALLAALLAAGGATLCRSATSSGKARGSNHPNSRRFVSEDPRSNGCRYRIRWSRSL